MKAVRLILSGTSSGTELEIKCVLEWLEWSVFVTGNQQGWGPWAVGSVLLQAGPDSPHAWVHRQPKAAPALRRRPQTQRGINKGESEIAQQNNCKFNMVTLIPHHQPASEPRKGKMFKDFIRVFFSIWCLFIAKVRRRISLPLIQLFWFLDRFMVAVSKDLFWEAMFPKNSSFEHPDIGETYVGYKSDLYPQLSIIAWSS